MNWKIEKHLHSIAGCESNPLPGAKLKKVIHPNLGGKN
jgi:hypothetical protein